MDKKHLLESASLVGEPSADGTWKVRLISEGKGSSGTYTAELIEKHYSAFNNVLSFKNHPNWDGPQSRDFTMIAGKVVGEAWVDTDERGLKAIYANYLPDPEYRDKLERYKDQLGLSIYIEGSGYFDEDDEFIVDWFNPADPYASVDVVIAAGARGKFMESMRKTYESATAGSDKPAVTLAEENGVKMDQEIKERFDALDAKFAALVDAKSAEEATAAKVEADAAAVAAAVEKYAEAERAVEAAELYQSQKDSILAEAKRGVDVAPLIEAAQAVAAEAKAAAEAQIAESGAPTGRVVTESAKFESATDLGKVFG